MLGADLQASDVEKVFVDASRAGTSGGAGGVGRAEGMENAGGGDSD